MIIYKHHDSTSTRIVIAMRSQGDPMSPMVGHAVLYVMDVLKEGRSAGYRVGNVQDLWVREDHRRNGYAKLMMEKVHSHARRLGLRSLTLMADPESAGKYTLFESMGYQMVDLGFQLIL